MVMRGQTSVQWGSVYLYNEQNEKLEVKTYHPQKYENTDTDAFHKARTFSIGEGIAGRAAAETQIIYIADTSKDDTFNSTPGDDGDARAIICVPMMDNNKVFGVMNFCGDVGKVKFEESDIEFAESIARMAVVSFKNIQMLNVIEEQNRTLEQKVEQRTAQLVQKTHDINNMLQNMHQGIFTITTEGKVHPEYSAYLQSIIEHKNVADSKIMDLLFSNTTLGSNATNQICTALQAILGEDSMMFDFNKHCLVNEFVMIMPDKREKILELDWDPLLATDDSIDKLMVTVRDVTDLRGLQAEAEKQKAELEIIGQILSASTSKFVAFSKDTHKFIEENTQIIKNTNQPSQDDIALLFRNMHTIKGNARTYNFLGITDSSHEAEHAYDVYRKDPGSGWDKQKILDELNAVRDSIQAYDNIYDKKLASENNADGIFIDNKLMEKLNFALQEFNDTSAEHLNTVINNVRSITAAIGTESIPNLLSPIIKSMPSMAKKLGKISPEIIIKDNDIRLNSEIVPVLKNVFNHEFRNSIDHGLGSAQER